MVAANHNQGLMDGILLVAALPRRLRPVAKAPLFRHPIIGPLTRLSGAIPVHRRQDERSGAIDNEAMFSAAESALAMGDAILIFPEGVSQPEPALMPLRTGTARLLLGAARDSGALIEAIEHLGVYVADGAEFEPRCVGIGVAVVASNAATNNTGAQLTIAQALPPRFWCPGLDGRHLTSGYFVFAAWRGLRASFRPSPRKLIPNVTTPRTMPGMPIRCG